MIIKVITHTLVSFLLVIQISAAEEMPFNISVHGNFKQMLHAGDGSGKIALASISRSAGTYGVGALADLRGEIMIWDGDVLVTPGDSAAGSTQPAAGDAQAALLVTTQVNEWVKINVQSDMTQKEFERYVIDNARSNGIDTHKPFPFLVTGEITDCNWHVVTGTAQRNGDGAHQQGHAGSRIFSQAETKGKLIGFYSSEELEGVISPVGKRFHAHYADDNLKISGHLDSFGVQKGATLRLPKR